ncbi:retrotransposon protein, putative, ty1-copia subclass [Tanacetum coccineum]|uniref:Retrotransposon protein, putative, ty1-copia subclass n=1 Tax=Tanacetum coccineum TaxID=301880 RepID=A0ABQ5HZR0_9ASTR
MSADVARGHGGDDGGDDRPPPYQVPTGCGGCLGNRGKGTRKPNLGSRRVGRLHTRQETRNLGLKAITDKSGPVPIRFEVNDRETLMPLGDHAAHWANYLGELVRELPLHYPSWRQIPPERKAGVVANIGIYNGKKAALKERYWVPEEDGTYDLERIRRGRPSHISEVDWDAQLAFWNDPKNLARAAQNKQNRAKSKVMETSATREYRRLIHSLFLTLLLVAYSLKPRGQALLMRSWPLFAGASSGGTFPVLDGFCQDRARSFLPHLKARTPPISLGSKSGRSSYETSELVHEKGVAGVRKLCQADDEDAARMRTIVRGFWVKDLEIIQEEDTHPSIDTSLNHEEDDLEIDESQSDIIPIRRSTRTRHAPDRMCLYVDAEEHELRDLGEPANYKAALLDRESEKWLNAMNVEMQSMKDNEVWDLVDLPPNGKTIGSKWLFKKKTNMDGAVHTFKARLVAKGFTQTYRFDYEETFSLVADIRAIRILIAIIAHYDYEIWQIDVKTAFLNRHLSEEVYMKQPKGDIHWTTMKNIPKYLMNTKDMFLVYGGAVDWKSTKLSIIVNSSAEAEYIAAYDASKEAVWVRKFIYGLGVVPTIEERINMYCDNTGSITMANESGITKGARHLCAKVHYLREVIEYGDIKLEKVHTDDDLAHPFTKALAFPKHSEHTKNIRMLPASSLM